MYTNKIDNNPAIRCWKRIHRRIIIPIAVSFVLQVLLVSIVFGGNFQPNLINNLDFIIQATNNRTVGVVRNDSYNEVSPVGFVADGLIVIYQQFISAQSKSVCNFKPSCSKFARAAIGQSGFFIGSLLASDRILRCHPYSKHLYKFDPIKMKAIDPLSGYRDDSL